MPLCEGSAPAQERAPTLSCEQREEVHRVLPWAVRTYYYGTAARPARANDTYDGAWYGAQRAEGTRLVSRYLRLQPALGAQLLTLEHALLGRPAGARRGPVLGVHLRGTDKGKYL